MTLTLEEILNYGRWDSKDPYTYPIDIPNTLIECPSCKKWLGAQESWYACETSCECCGGHDILTHKESTGIDCYFDPYGLEGNQVFNVKDC